MNDQHQVRKLSLAVLALAALLFLVWIGSNFKLLTGDQNGTIRFVMSTVFALLILFRSAISNDQHDTAWRVADGGMLQPAVPTRSSERSIVPSAIVAVVGAIAAISGIVFTVHQFEWLGIILILYGCLSWGLPSRFSRDIPLALLLLYWIHPLPNQLFAPLQFVMQKFSVLISEWLLHMLNIPVWADGLILKTGLAEFEVPQWCSGMRTATTVLLLSLGLGILMRCKWYECAVLAVAGLTQALLVNVIRISAMVTLAPKMGPGSGVDFLHDSTGVVMSFCVVLVSIEVFAIRSRRRKRAVVSQEIDPEHMKSVFNHPPFWHVIFTNKTAIFFILLILSLAAGLAFKSRSHHRADMLKPVAIDLRDSRKPSDMSDAIRLADIIHGLVPNDSDWSMMRTRMLLMHRSFDTVLHNLDDMAIGAVPMETEKKILRAYAMMGLDRPEDAAALIHSLPEQMRTNDPRVAMILAEMAFRGDQPDKVCKHIMLAMKWIPNTPRIRALYPYLRSRKRWTTIVKSDARVPYQHPMHALSACEAYMNFNDTPAVAGLTMQALEKWPDDPRILIPLFFMATRRTEGVWEDRFAIHLRKCAGLMTNADGLYNLFDKCFNLGRPDLAWTLVNRISALEPKSPYVPMAGAIYGERWFSFRRRFLGLTPSLSSPSIDLKPFYTVGMSFPAWQNVRTNIPFRDTLSLEDTVPHRKALLADALAKFKTYDTDSRMSLPMRRQYVMALEIDDDLETGQDQLNKIAAQLANGDKTKQMALSEIYERDGKWLEVYETLRDYLPPDAKPGEYWETQTHLAPLLRLCRAEIQLGLGLKAVYTAEEAVRLYPNSIRAADLLSVSLLRHGAPEKALQILSRPRPFQKDRFALLEAEALFMTKRFKEMDRFCKTLFIQPVDVPRNALQPLFLPPAELSLIWHHVYTPSKASLAKNAQTLKGNIDSAEANPFFRKFISLWLDEHREAAVNESATLKERIDTWSIIGRNRFEKAASLNNLTILLCHRNEIEDATTVADAAATLFPESPALWHVLISLSKADPNIVRRARVACPHDADIWLADLVLSARAGKLATMLKSSDLESFSSATLTRASEHLFRIGHKKEAAKIARQATSRARGLLPAYAIGLQCALNEADRTWALFCTRMAIEHSLDPAPFFFSTLVKLKTSGGKPDTDKEMIYALQQLRSAEPKNPLWPHVLGYVRFSRGGGNVVDAMEQMLEALEQGSNDPAIYMIASSCSRQIGNIDKAIELLKRGRAEHPQNIDLLNDLIYALSLSEKGVDEAITLLPSLEIHAKKDLTRRDTVAVTYMKAGQLEKAKKLLSGILAEADANTASWFRAHLHLADIALQQDETSKAEMLLKTILQNSRGISNEDIVAANRLRELIESRKHPAPSAGSDVKLREETGGERLKDETEHQN